MTLILIFGDSITYGAWDIEGGWVQKLRNYFDKKTVSKPEYWNSDYLLIYNLGISGNTVTDVLKRFKAETDARLVEKAEDEKVIFIFEIGMNDSCILKDEGLFAINPHLFEWDLRALINAVEEYSYNIIFVGATKVDESKTTPVPWDTNRIYKNRDIQKYNNIIQGNCKGFMWGDNRWKLYYIDIFKQFEKRQDYKNLLADGLHPNTEGNNIIFEAVKKYLNRKV